MVEHYDALGYDYSFRGWVWVLVYYTATLVYEIFLSPVLAKDFYMYSFEAKSLRGIFYKLFYM